MIKTQKKQSARLLKLILLMIAVLHIKVALAAKTQIVEDQQNIIKRIQQLMLEHYVLLDKAEAVNAHLETIIKQEKFSASIDQKEFTSIINKEIQSILDDKHFNLILPRLNSVNNTEDIFDTHLSALTNFRQGGFQDIRIFPGNIGYVKVDGFRREDKHQVDALMNYLSTTDAIIIDIQENGGGGSPVNYLSSYFLEKDTLIGKTYHRQKDSWKKLIASKVKGQRRVDVPLFILTSSYTFSAAEAFSYNLQALGRATIIGETTGGGAHPISFFQLPEGFGIIIPNKRSYNPITKTNWQGVGVIPDVVTTKKAALEKAKEMAKHAAIDYRTQLFNQLSTLFSNNNKSNIGQIEVTKRVKKLITRKHIEPFMVTFFASRYQQQGNYLAANLLFQANIDLNKNKAEPHYLFAQALVTLNMYPKAKYHFEKAITIAKNNNNERLTHYQKEMDSQLQNL